MITLGLPYSTLCFLKLTLRYCGRCLRCPATWRLLTSWSALGTLPSMTSLNWLARPRLQRATHPLNPPQKVA